MQTVPVVAAILAMGTVAATLALDAVVAISASKAS
jgi:hypothetical protein